MKLSPYLTPELVTLDLRARDLPEAIAALVERVRALGVVEDSAALSALLLSQEARHTTAMGDGVAIPHATLAGLERPVLMVAVAREGADFGPIGLDPVHLFFLLLSPEDQTGLHIKILARITRLIRHPDFVGRLRRARSSAELIEEIERVDAEHL
jgi:PTS system nitrogen regulatory IIA component